MSAAGAAIASLAAKAALLRVAADLIDQASHAGPGPLTATLELRAIARRVAEIRAAIDRDRMAIEVPAVLLELQVRPHWPVPEADGTGNLIRVIAPGVEPEQGPRELLIPATRKQIFAMFARASEPKVSLALIVHPEVGP